MAPEILHVMVTRTDRLGDLILTAPLLHAVKQHFPRARVSLLASAANAQLAAAIPAIDAVEVDRIEARHSGWRGVLALAHRLRELHIDVILFANAKHRLALAAWLARIPVRIGSTRRAYSILYTGVVKALPFEHEADAALRLLQPLGIHTTSLPTPPWHVAETDRSAISDLLAARGIRPADALAILHSTNSGNAMTASPAWYAALGDALREAGYVVVLTGTEHDRPVTAAIAGAMRQRPVDLSGELTLGRLTALLARSSICVGNSTGPTHLAAALGTPTIGLYAPLLKQQRWLPRGPAIQVVRPEVGMSCPRCV